MKQTVPLSTIVDALEDTFSDWEAFLNTETGEIESIPSWESGVFTRDEFEEEIERIDNSDSYVRLPTQWDLHEYKIMWRFAELKDSDPLFRALNGKKPYRHFKDRAADLDLLNDYFAFRREAYADIAREWCLENEIPFEDDFAPAGPPITMHLFYTGKNGAARRFAEEMEASGTADAIRAEVGNLRYEYFTSLVDPETVLLVDAWRSQAALDAHHATPMMRTIAELRDKYDLHMRVERLVADEASATDSSFVRR